MTDRPENDTCLTLGELKALLASIFVRHGVSKTNAEIVAANCAGCERDGSLSHGVFRMPGYVSSLTSGWVDGKAVGVVEDVGASFIRVDARNGFAQPALELAMPLFKEKVSNNGMAVLAMKDSHHFSALWPDLEPLAQEGLVAISMVSGLACVAPHGGRHPVLGTNPIAFATPVANAGPMVFDFATSSMSNGDLRIAAREGHEVALGAGVDANGEFTTDPAAILSGGALLPFGGHKGGAISLMVEVLASALTGGQFSYEVDFSGYPGAETPKTGQIIIAIDPLRGATGSFTARVADLFEAVRQSGQTRLPSDRRYATRALSDRKGILLKKDVFQNLVKLSQ